MLIIKNVHHLPLWLLGLKDIPAFPIQLEAMADTLLKLGIRTEQTKQAKQGLTNTYTIGGVTATGYEFVFGRTPGFEEQVDEAREHVQQVLTLQPALVLTSLFDKALRDTGESVAASADPITALPLDKPEQWALSWTTFPEVYQKAAPLLPDWASTLTDPDAASARFWPTIAEYGQGYNLLILQKVGPTQLGTLKGKFQPVWTPALDAAAAAGTLYVIDLSLFESLEPHVVRGAVRFTPATVTLLTQDPATKALTPVAVRVSGAAGAGAQLYSRANATGSAWLYALQAAKTSVTVYGIWLGHVYHWHIVTAPMQMALYNNVPLTHPLSLFLGPRSNYLIPFDDVLIVLWQFIAPPTSISTPFQFLTLANRFATGRSFFDDDPPTALANLGLWEADFTVKDPWDRYPIVGRLLDIWGASSDYAAAFVNVTYADDRAVAADPVLQAWAGDCSSPDEGNVRGLPPLQTRAALASVLTSLVFRVTAHGAARLNAVASPGLTFVANFPPCLQDATIPAPSSSFDTARLLAYLPRTGTIGEMVTFYFTFAFSVPYVPLIPLEGLDANLSFPGGTSEARNQALIAFRTRILAFINRHDTGTPQRFQWPLNIET
jgi:Lipoxygenase